MIPDFFAVYTFMNVPAMFGEKTLNSKLLFNEKALQRLMTVKIKAVLFDLGGTLVKSQPVSEVWGKILKAHGIKRTTEEIEQARTVAEKNVDMRELPILGEAFWLKGNTYILNNLGIRAPYPSWRREYQNYGFNILT